VHDCLGDLTGSPLPAFRSQPFCRPPSPHQCARAGASVSADARAQSPLALGPLGSSRFRPCAPIARNEPESPPSPAALPSQKQCCRAHSSRPPEPPRRRVGQKKTVPFGRVTDPQYRAPRPRLTLRPLDLPSAVRPRPAHRRPESRRGVGGPSSRRPPKALPPRGSADVGALRVPPNETAGGGEAPRLAADVRPRRVGSRPMTSVCSLSLAGSPPRRLGLFDLRVAQPGTESDGASGRHR